MASHKISYEYDAAGNRTRMTDHLSGEETTYTYDVRNQLQTMVDSSGTTTFTYDMNGNRIRKETPADMIDYTWDGQQRLVKVETANDEIDFTYNPDGQRVKKESNAGTVSYLYDFNHLLQEMNGDDQTDKLYTFTDDEWGDLVSEYGEEDGSLYHQYDAQWSTQALLDEDQSVTDRYKYRAFGVQDHAVGSSKAPHTFVGKQGYYRDTELDLYMLGMGNGDGRGGRFYDPELGRFISEDPRRHDAGDENLYRYVKNNPINQIDPSGQFLGLELPELPRFSGFSVDTSRAKGISFSGSASYGGSKVTVSTSTAQIADEAVATAAHVADDTIATAAQIAKYGKEKVSLACACAKKAPATFQQLLTLQISTLYQLTGLRKPSGLSPPQLVDKIIELLDHPCLRLFDAYEAVRREVKDYSEDRKAFVSGVWKLYEDVTGGANEYLQKLSDTLKTQFQELGQKARTKWGEFTNAAGQWVGQQSAATQLVLGGVWEAIQTMVETALNEISWEKFWEFLKETVKEQLWPIPSVVKGIGEWGKAVGSAFESLWELDLQQAKTHYLEGVQKTLAIINSLATWVSILIIGVTTIAGLIFGGPAGAGAGFLAGLKAAAAFGTALAIANAVAQFIFGVDTLNDLHNFELERIQRAQGQPQQPQVIQVGEAEAEPAQQEAQPNGGEQAADADDPPENIVNKYLKAAGIVLSLALMAVFFYIGAQISKFAGKAVTFIWGWLKKGAGGFKKLVTKLRALFRKVVPRKAPRVSETRGAVTNLGTRTVAENSELFAKLSPGEGMSGVFDHSSGKFVLRHSTEVTPLPEGSVFRYGGHADVRADLGRAIGEDLTSTARGRVSGFSLQKQADGTVRFGWNSGQINPGSHGSRSVPESLRASIEAAVRETLAL